MEHWVTNHRPEPRGRVSEEWAVELSVVIPAYNEMGRLPQTLDKVLAYLEQRGGGWEVIVSDDGSTDGTATYAAGRDPRCRVLLAPVNQGKGAAVRRGMLAARGRLRLFTDADLSTPIEEMDGMIAALERGDYDIVIASRALSESRLVVRQPWWREFSGRMFNRIVQPLSGLPIHDTQCGFKLFRAEAAERIFSLSRANGWAFDVEALMLAQVLGYSVLEHPVCWINSEATKVSLLSDAPRMVRDLIVFRWRRWRGTMLQQEPEPKSH